MNSTLGNILSLLFSVKKQSKLEIWKAYTCGPKQPPLNSKWISSKTGCYNQPLKKSYWERWKRWSRLLWDHKDHLLKETPEIITWGCHLRDDVAASYEKSTTQEYKRSKRTQQPSVTSEEVERNLGRDVQDLLRRNKKLKLEETNDLEKKLFQKLDQLIAETESPLINEGLADRLSKYWQEHSQTC